MHPVLVAEEECEIREYLKLALTLCGLKVEFAQSGRDVLSLLGRQDAAYSLVLMDVLMSARDGIQSLKAVRELKPDVPVIMMSSAATPSMIVTAIASGAKDFLAKPISHDDLRSAIERTLNITLPLQRATAAVDASSEEESSVAAGAWSQKIDLLLDRVALSDVPVLLQGETGVGKEVLGRKLHARSRRANRPFLKLNCAALPSELVESELFGYEKGAFTGAFKNTPGKFEMANGGTILLDEIGDMDFKLQAKLLQVIQDKEFLRLGAKEPSRVDVRIMAASHCDFDKAIREGRFREDLFYRLNIIDIHIPPLRERVDEILPLAELFIKKHATADTPALEISPTLKQTLLEHTWPGNVRELENVMQKYLVLRNPVLIADEIQRRVRKGTSHSSVVRVMEPRATQVKDVPAALAEPPLFSAADSRATKTVGEMITAIPHCEYEPEIPTYPRAFVPANTFAATNTFTAASQPTAAGPTGASAAILSDVQNAHRAAEAEAIVSALNSTYWNRKQAASVLNIDYKALLYKMKKLGIGDKTAVAG